MTTQHDIIPLLIGSIIAWILYCVFWWFIISKFGWRDRARFILMALMAIPPAHPALVPIGTGCLIFMLVWRWPIYKELRELRQFKKQVESAASSSVDAELEQLRRQIN